MRKIIFVVFIVILLIGITGASKPSLGTFRQNNCFQLVQTCDNCNYNNISYVNYPDGSTIPGLSNIKMEKHDTYYNYTFCNTTKIGTYNVNGFGDDGGTKTAWVYDFEITYTGVSIDTSKSMLYLGFLTMLILLFVFTLASIPKLPKGNNTTEDGSILSINNLKYLRPVLYGISWFLALAIIFISSNVALAFLPNTMMGNFLFVIYRIMFIMTFPMILIWFIFIFKRIFEDREIKRLIERGVDIKGGYI